VAPEAEAMEAGRPVAMMTVANNNAVASGRFLRINFTRLAGSGSS
jgi:hypothetical protein